MLFLLDAQLPRALAGRIAALGHSALHMSERLPGYASDPVVAELANSLGAVLVSKDQDFIDLSVRGVLEGQLLWIRSGNMTTRRLWEQIGPLLPEAIRAFEEGERIVEIR